MAKKVWVERNKDGSWDAFGDDGAHIKFGHGQGLFDPGDLMKLALAGCAALSSQVAVESTLGEGKGATISVDGTYDDELKGFASFKEQIELDASSAGLHNEDVEKFKERVQKHIERSCMVMHTYEHATPVSEEITVKQ
ncbi:peroxiredoxin [Bifidobacterium aemilianum]|uniref:Peroxiredoxin n=1 Tax=Bifidobacterium aemilianum TaxID=2493120 RepID=A0A366K8E5_9BIFI|nr:OsmC family protein [Bifidobacterium aemilianum]RBP97393.1 peroxiredoxin [Bifidobacterium aemilianum]